MLTEEKLHQKQRPLAEENLDLQPKQKVGTPLHCASRVIGVPGFKAVTPERTLAPCPQRFSQGSKENWKAGGVRPPADQERGRPRARRNKIRVFQQNVTSMSPDLPGEYPLLVGGILTRSSGRIGRLPGETLVTTW